MHRRLKRHNLDRHKFYLNFDEQKRIHDLIGV